MPRRNQSVQPRARINLNEGDVAFHKQKQDLATYKRLPLRDRTNIELSNEILNPRRGGDPTRIAALRNTLGVLYQLDRDPSLLDDKPNTQKVKQLIEGLEKLKGYMHENAVKDLTKRFRPGVKDPYHGILQEWLRLANKLSGSVVEREISSDQRQKIQGLRRDIQKLIIVVHPQRDKTEERLREEERERLHVWQLEQTRLREREQERLRKLEEMRLREQELLRAQEERLRQLEREQDRLRREQEKSRKTQAEMASGINIDDLRQRTEQRKKEKTEQDARLTRIELTLHQHSEEFGKRDSLLEQRLQRFEKELTTRLTQRFETAQQLVSERVSVLERDNQQLKEMVGALNSQLKIHEQTLRTHSVALQKLNGIDPDEVGRLRRDLGQLTGRVDGHDARLKAHDTFGGRLGVHDSALQRLGEQFNGLHGQVSTQDRTLKTHQQTLQDLDRRIGVIKPGPADGMLGEQVRRLSEQVGAHDERLHQLGRNVDDLTGRVDGHDAFGGRLDGHDEALQGLQGLDVNGLRRLSGRVDEHDRALHQLDGVDLADIGRLRHDHGQLRGEFDIDHAALGQLRHDHDGLRGEFDIDHGHLGQVRVAHAALRGEFDIDHAALGQLRHDHDGLRGEFDIDHGHLGQVRVAHAALRGEFDIDHAALGQLRHDYDGLRGEFNADHVVLQGDHMMLQGDHAALQNNGAMLTQYQHQVAQIDGNFDARVAGIVHQVVSRQRR